jgi:hypothetical protein
MDQKAKELLQQVSHWPEEDQEELAELARDIEARRSGVYILTEAERAALADAQKTEFASEADIAAFWKRHGIA